MEKQIFISYRRTDSVREAKMIEAQLEEFQCQVFRDESDIQVAERFPDRIKSALDQADVVIVVIGKKWLDACDDSGDRRLYDSHDFVRREIDYALKRTQRDVFLDVIPVLVQGARMPKAEELPKSLRGLAAINAHRISPGTFDADVFELSKRIDALTAEHGQRAESELDRFEEEFSNEGDLAFDVSVKPSSAGIPGIRDLPELATWKCTIGKRIELSFQTKESGKFDGESLKPQRVRIEGDWRIKPSRGGSLVMTLEGSTFDGDDFVLAIPIERDVGERSYSGRNESGEYCRLEWISRSESSEDRF
jgi:hypothetical protein